MRIAAFALCTAALAAAAPPQQGGETASHVFYFAAADSPQDMQQTANVIRTVVQLTQVALSTDARSLTIQAAPSDTAIAQWLFQELDAPQAAPPASSQVDRYPGLSAASDRLCLFRAAHVNAPQVFQETVNAVRTIPEITRAFPYTRTWTIVVRGTGDQAALAEWLFRQIDRPAPPAGQTLPEQSLHTSDARNPETRVLFFAHAGTPQSRQEIVNGLRVIAELTKVFQVMGKNAVALRGSPGPVALAEWLFGQLDRSGPEASAKTSGVQPVSSDPGPPGYFTPPIGTVAQVFFLPASVSPETLQQTVNSVRTAAGKSARVWSCTTSGSLAVRGAPDRLAQAAAIVKSAANPQ